MDIRTLDEALDLNPHPRVGPMALREVRDDSGMLWTIWDVHPSMVRHGVLQVREELASGWLCFQSDGAKRRLVGIPSEWEQLDEGGLISLMTAAAIVSAGAQKIPQS